MPPLPFLKTRLMIGLLCAALMGCAQLPVEQGRASVAERLDVDAAALANVDEVGDGPLDPALRAQLEQPLSADAAVALAWRNSPRVKAALAKLGLAAADWWQERRPRNPVISYAQLGNGESRERTLGLHWALTDLLLLPARRQVAEQDWRAATASVVGMLQDEATAVRRDYYHYQAAIQVAAMRAAVADAAQLSADLAERFHRAGNISELQLAREQANAIEARHEAAQAKGRRLAARMALAERLGLAGRSNRWSVPEQLPLPVALDLPVEALLQQAREQRQDLLAARLRLDSASARWRLTRRSGWLDELELELEREREGSERRDGIGLGLALPLFDQGQAARGRRQARQQIAQQRVTQIEQRIEGQVRTRAAQLQTQAEIIDSYAQALLPARQRIVQRETERYNFMLIGVFELLEARRSEFDSWERYFEAIADYWITHAELGQALGRPLALPDSPQLTPPIEQIVAPAGANAGSHHGHH